MKNLMLFLAVLIIPLTFMKYKEEEQIVIPNDAIRIRIIANSNSYQDQSEKLKVRDNLQSYLEKILKNAKTKEESEKIIKENIDTIDKNVRDTLKEIKSSTKYVINYGNNYFPKKEFKGITYKEGYYDSLVITLGSGRGDNWWCVLFPPLCLMETEEAAMDDVEYKLFVDKIISDYK